MNEATIVRKILEGLRGVDQCFCWKEYIGLYSTAGIPDVIVCYKGLFYGLEVKMPGKYASDLQSATINKIQAAGGVAGVVYSWDDAQQLIFGGVGNYEKRKKAQRLLESAGET